jgi:7-cyano-7-deazaguanine synthase
MSINEAVVLMSGGIDSYACAHLLRSQGFHVEGVFIDHGQAATTFERRAVQQISALLDIPISNLKVSGGLPFSSGELIGRNAFLIATAMFMTRRQSGLIAIGIHAGTPYYDCSPLFIESMNRLVGEQTDGALKLVAPFLNWTKKDIFDYSISSSLSLHVTYSCEAGTESGCGQCASCKDRKALNAI